MWLWLAFPSSVRCGTCFFQRVKILESPYITQLVALWTVSSRLVFSNCQPFSVIRLLIRHCCSVKSSPSDEEAITFTLWLNRFLDCRAIENGVKQCAAAVYWRGKRRGKVRSFLRGWQKWSLFDISSSLFVPWLYSIFAEDFFDGRRCFLENFEMAWPW